VLSAKLHGHVDGHPPLVFHLPLASGEASLGTGDRDLFLAKLRLASRALTRAATPSHRSAKRSRRDARFGPTDFGVKFTEISSPGQPSEALVMGSECTVVGRPHPFPFSLPDGRDDEPVAVGSHVELGIAIDVE
jgi:hypothetical protein